MPDTQEALGEFTANEKAIGSKDVLAIFYPTQSLHPSTARAGCTVCIVSFLNEVIAYLSQLSASNFHTADTRSVRQPK